MKHDRIVKSHEGYHEVSQSSAGSTAADFDPRLSTRLHYESHGFAVALSWISVFILIISLTPLYEYIKYRNNYLYWDQKDYFILSNAAAQCLLLPFNLLAEIKHKASLYLLATFYYIVIGSCCYFILNNPMFTLISFLILCFYSFGIIKITRHKMYAKSHGAVRIQLILGGYI
uniref:Uncharacterized protein n=1 Tax=Panagrolaimus sp. ES5 TaxID=591445 RepID=A0AC34GNB4_9BILA